MTYDRWTDDKIEAELALRGYASLLDRSHMSRGDMLRILASDDEKTARYADEQQRREAINADIRRRQEMIEARHRTEEERRLKRELRRVKRRQRSEGAL